MGQALYRKHRPKSLDDVVGQEHITTTLKKAIKSGRISHAYLFTGPKGVGKTSIARILAHEINGLPYTDDSVHLDIIEIDAASNRRIDEIRELRDKVYVAPTSATYKVYIIDEVHMLTREAFNALLKTLEEPPAHAVFILATTDAHKLPETIISRTQRFTFKPLEQAKVVAHLRQLATEERIDISDEALQLLAEHGEGSFRDSISLLDQTSNHGKKVSAADVRNLLGTPPRETIEQLASSLAGHATTSEIMHLISQLYEQGYQAAGIAKQLGTVLRSQLTTGSTAIPMGTALHLLARLIDVPASHDPERLLEIILLETAVPHTASTPTAASKSTPLPQPTPEKPSNPRTKITQKQDSTAVPVASSPPATDKGEPQQTAPEVNAPTLLPPSEVQVSSVLDEAIWPEVLNALKQKHNTLYGVVRMAHPNFSTPGKLELAFAFAFHQKRINDNKNRAVLGDIIEQLTGQKVEIECLLKKDMLTTPTAPAVKAAEVEAPPATSSQAMSTISTIFGGGELV